MKDRKKMEMISKKRMRREEQYEEVEEKEVKLEGEEEMNNRK